MPRLSVYCCPMQATAAGVRVASRGECPGAGPGVEVAPGKVLVRLRSKQLPRGEVMIRLLPEDETVFCDAGTPTLRFGRAIRTSETESTVAMLDELALLLKHPDHCRWLATTAHASGPETHEPRRIGPLIIPGTPEGNARSRPVLPAANGRSVVHITGAEAVPGDQLQLVWDFGGGAEEKVVTRVHAGGWLETPCLRGGRIVETAGEIGSEDRRFLVRGHGLWTICSASDHVPYAVGDWVFFSLVNSACTRGQWWERYMTLDLRDLSGGSQTLPEEQPRPALEAGMAPQGLILPLECGGFSAQSPAFEPYAPPVVSGSRMGDILDLCLRRGTVIEVRSDGTLAVELPWGRENGLPAHYHCPGAATIAGGHTAFQPEDEVLVVSTRGRELAHAVIGFADKRPRPCAEYLVIATGIPEHNGRQFYLVWDALLGGPAEDLPDGHGGLLSPLVFPCTREVIQHWLDQSRAVPVADQMPGLLDAERLGFVDSVNGRYDDRPSPARQCAGLSCNPPGGCLELPFTVGGDVLGGHCGACQDEDRQPNAYAGQDVATLTRETSHSRVEEEDHVYDYRAWREEHPYLQCERRAAGPHPATSLRCVWGGFEAAVQVSRRYDAWREVRFATDYSENSVIFEEAVTDRIVFPGIAHRSSFEWTDVTRSSRPAASVPGGGSGAREWVWNDRTVTVNGFGLRTQRSWLFAYVLVSRRWQIAPYAGTGKVPAPGFDISVAAGAGSVLEHPLGGSPFALPTDATLEAALAALVQAAFDDADFSQGIIHSENAFVWEVRV
ncbi:hypothetical protein [Megalodesulfovibrio paquesii]